MDELLTEWDSTRWNPAGGRGPTELYTCVFEGAILSLPQLSSESRSASGVRSVRSSSLLLCYGLRPCASVSPRKPHLRDYVTGMETTRVYRHGEVRTPPAGPRAAWLCD